MSLFPTKESGNWEARTDNVYFFMTHGGDRIRCGVTGRALEALEPKLELSGKGRLDAFDTHRAIIERMVSAKFDNKKWEWDGITLLVREADIEPSVSCRRCLPNAPFAKLEQFVGPRAVRLKNL